MDWVLRRSYSCGQSDCVQIVHYKVCPYKESNAAEVTSDLQVTLHHLLAVGNHHVTSLLSCGTSVLRLNGVLTDSRPTKVVDNVATQETSSAKDGRGVA